jgi:hypothetical protein
MRKLQLLVGIVLALAAAAGVFFVGKMTQPPTFDVVIAVDQIPPFAVLGEGDVSVDTQSVSPRVARGYVQAKDWQEMITRGPVATVEQLHPGQPLMREQVVSGADVAGLDRLSVALENPNQVIVSVPIKGEATPSVVPGDVVALYFSIGRINAQQLITEVVTGPESTPSFGDVTTMTISGVEAMERTTETIEVDMPLSKQIAEGVVYRLNRVREKNPNYGRPGAENEPMYIEGELLGLDVVVEKETAEWISFALVNGNVRIGVLPAVTRPDVEADTLPATEGVTWTDFEDLFFEDRGVGSDE